MKSKAPIVSYLIFPVMLILPIMAIIRITQSIDIIYVVGYLGVISVITVFAYKSDKRKAESNSWRTPEATLHLYEFLGGWAAGFCSQRIFRHKISKKGYQSGFWFIAVIHQYMAFDYMQDWKFARAAFQFIEAILK
ncbi:MAG: DUF1294 domain-containing protein [Kiritimatiellales bacterium]|nr:DUF1294 domain-containing protein [Kiritimatiellota bacterium]MBL7012636.1 DUF1294 domain-containing protein [Kiritimatiellales bacterium]